MPIQNKDELILLQEIGKYLFHGSPTEGIKIFEPRQSHTIPPGEDESVPDGEPAVAASPYAEIAIFRALVRKRSGFSAKGEGQLSFRATREALDDAKDKKGFVYVFSREGFEPKNGSEWNMDWRSLQSVKPLVSFEVTYDDLPESIEILSE